MGEVAKELGVARGTIANWRRGSAFRVRVNQLQDDLRDAAKRKLYSMGEKATQKLGQIIENGDDRVALEAIKLLLTVTRLYEITGIIGPITNEDLIHQDKKDVELKTLLRA